MTALTQNRYSTRREGVRHVDPAAAGVHVYAGAIVVIDTAGNAAPATTATGLTARGVATAEVDNTGGAAGARDVATEAGVYRLANDASIDRTLIGQTAYIVDDQTVAATDGTGTRSPAGLIDDVDADGVYVHIGAGA